MTLVKLWAERDRRYVTRRLGSPLLTLTQERTVRAWRWHEAMQMDPAERGPALRATLVWTMPPRVPT